MTKPQSVLDLARHDAQELHKKISDNMAQAKAATWADVHAVQTEAHALMTKMKGAAEGQADAVKAGLTEASHKLQAAAKLVENKAVAVGDDVPHANQALLDSAHKAAQSLSAAVAALRTKAAHAIAPKVALAKVPA